MDFAMLARLLAQSRSGLLAEPSGLLGILSPEFAPGIAQIAASTKDSYAPVSAPRVDPRDAYAPVTAASGNQTAPLRPQDQYAPITQANATAPVRRQDQYLPMTPARPQDQYAPMNGYAPDPRHAFSLSTLPLSEESIRRMRDYYQVR